MMQAGSEMNVSRAGREVWRRAVRDESSARLLEAMVMSAFAVSPDAMRGPSRGSPDVALARQVAMYLAHTRLGLNFTTAGRLYRRDRTTAAHACRTVEERRENPALDAMLDCLERAIDVWPALSCKGGVRG